MTLRNQILESSDGRYGTHTEMDARIAVAGFMKPEIGNVIALNDVARPPHNIGGYCYGAEC